MPPEETPGQVLTAADIDTQPAAQLPSDRMSSPDLIQQAERTRHALIAALAEESTYEQQWPGRKGIASGKVPLSRIYQIGEVVLAPAGEKERWGHIDQQEGSVAITPRFQVSYPPYGAYDPHDKAAHAAYSPGCNYIEGWYTVEITEKGLRLHGQREHNVVEFPDIRALIKYLTTAMPYDWVSEERHYRWASGFGELEPLLETGQSFRGDLRDGIGAVGVIKSHQSLDYYQKEGARLDFWLWGKEGEMIGKPFQPQFEERSGKLVLKSFTGWPGLGEKFNAKVRKAIDQELVRLQSQEAA